jgi:AmmeMemoRadiSam system protein B
MFDSLTQPIPALRNDLEYIPFDDDNEDRFVLRDPQGYSDQMLVFPVQAWGLLMLFDGERSVEDIRAEFREAIRAEIDAQQIIDVIRVLDENLFLDTPVFRAYRKDADEEYISRPVRIPAHAGRSYPEDPAELRDFLSSLFDADETSPEQGRLLGIVVPHIDLQIGPTVYVPGFEQLRDREVDTVVVLGTSHYSAEDLFILTEKDFQSPLGTMPTDRELVEAIHRHSGGMFTRRDVAHRQEHSIEFPVLFLQHMFGGEDVRILPLLVTSFEEFLAENTRASSSKRYRAFLDAFRAGVAELGRRVLFVLSVDWSHIGRKFGDDVDAAEILDLVRKSDHEHFEALQRCDYDRFFELLHESGNVTKIDGFSCITTFFDLASPERGTLLRYEQWHEEERASAVTYASMAFFADEDSEDS